MTSLNFALIHWRLQETKKRWRGQRFQKSVLRSGPGFVLQWQHPEGRQWEGLGIFMKGQKLSPKGKQLRSAVILQELRNLQGLLSLLQTHVNCAPPPPKLWWASPWMSVKRLRKEEMKGEEVVVGSYSLLKFWRTVCLDKDFLTVPHSPKHWKCHLTASAFCDFW